MDTAEISGLARRYMEAAEALHTVHSSTDVHETGVFAGQAITSHCAAICNATGGYFFDPRSNHFVPGDDPHGAVREEYRASKAALEAALSGTMNPETGA